jgi:quinol monooxygenase YgiN
MLIVTGSVTAHSDTFERLAAVSLEHVQRSRTEPGCLSHAVYVDYEDPLRLFFFEQWADRAALDAHFLVPGTKAYVRELRTLAKASAGPTIFEIGTVTPP